MRVRSLVSLVVVASVFASGLASADENKPVKPAASATPTAKPAEAKPEAKPEGAAKPAAKPEGAKAEAKPEGAAKPAAKPEGAKAEAKPDGDRAMGDDAGPDPANKPEAEAAFKRGLELLAEDAWTAALAEFKRSRELYPTRNALNNAAVCLRKLNRYDEALDAFEEMLREYPNLPTDLKAVAQKEVAELRGLVGTIDIVGAEPGASIVVDGRTRQDYPLIDPLRVSSGTHTVRLFKGGFQPFESRVDVAGGQTVHVTAKMPALVASGRLRVVEKTGKKLEVVVDGAVAGVTPWESSLAIGDHVVLLRGDGDVGTQPVTAQLKQNEFTSLTLAAESLESSLLVRSKPAGARIAIDSVPVGHGIWDGRLRAGAHTITAEGEGFFPYRQQVSFERGERKELNLALQRDEDAEHWRKPSKLVVDVSGGFAMAPSFGGDVAGGCDGDCSRSVGLGGVTMLNVARELGSGFAFGLAGGFLQASQSVENRAETLSPVGIQPGLSGTANDELRLRGFLVGAAAGMHLGDRFPIRLRLGAGAFFANVKSVRSGSFTTRAGSGYDAPEVGSSDSATLIYVSPEASVGMHLTDQLELGLGLKALVLIATSSPRWGSGDNPEVVAKSDGLSSYSTDQKLLGTMVVLAPGLNATYSF